MAVHGYHTSSRARLCRTGELMTERAQQALVEETHLLLKKFTDEWDITLAEAIGCLELVIFDIKCNSIGEDNDEDEDYDE